MSIKVIPPLDKGTIGRIGWIARQLDSCKKKNEEIFSLLEKEIWIEANVKFTKNHLMARLNEIDELIKDAKGKEIHAFNVVQVRNFGTKFSSQKKFIYLIEEMVLAYYARIVQHMTNWSQHAPKIQN